VKGGETSSDEIDQCLQAYFVFQRRSIVFTRNQILIPGGQGVPSSNLGIPTTFPSLAMTKGHLQVI
jgi:hypothetical protein